MTELNWRNYFAFMQICLRFQQLILALLGDNACNNIIIFKKNTHAIVCGHGLEVALERGDMRSSGNRTRQRC